MINFAKEIWRDNLYEKGNAAMTWIAEESCTREISLRAPGERTNKIKEWANNS